jgi:class 3 adenylate cyclase
MRALETAHHKHAIAWPAVPHRRSLFKRYFATLFVAVVVPLILAAASETWFGYRDQRIHLNDLLQAETRSSAGRIQAFIDEICDQTGWVVQFPWNDGQDDQHKIDAQRLLEQVPAILSVRLIDQAGTERIFVSRLDLNRIGRGATVDAEPAVIGARAHGVWYGPVQYRRDSEPYMTIAVAGNRTANGLAIAEINLKLIWDVISQIKIGRTGSAFVVDDTGRLIAHPDISLVLRGHAGSADFHRIESVLAKAKGATVRTTDHEGENVVAAAMTVPGVGWTVIAQLPASEAFGTIRAALLRSLALILVGTLLAIGLAYWLANRMSGPIMELEQGVERIGAGQFDHRIAISSGDELERLASRFNQMARELVMSMEKSARIDRLKRFLAPQVAELVEQSDERMLDGQRRDVVVIFGDLRNFTGFCAQNEPDVIMAVLGEYYAALGAVIGQHEATLIGFRGDGVMILVNAPVPHQNPALRGIRLAIDMQTTVQSCITRWRADGHDIGFGVGIAMGTAIVGTVGYEGRIDYTANGNVVNLASRLCGAASDRQILIDPILAERVKDRVLLEFLGLRLMKGFENPLPTFEVARRVGAATVSA